MWENKPRLHRASGGGIASRRRRIAGQPDGRPGVGYEGGEVSSVMRRIRLFAMDVDGTLTDGTITYTADGSELKTFHARDGQGIKLLRLAGIVPALISGRTSAHAARRAAELGIEEVHQGVHDKAAVLDALCARMGLCSGDAGFIGDDLSDIPAMRHAGFSAAPANAAPETRAAATFVCSADGGMGAVREAIEALLRSQNRWDDVLSMLDAAAQEAGA